jgi:hypothetical protein
MCLYEEEFTRFTRHAAKLYQGFLLKQTLGCMLHLFKEQAL